MQIAGVVDAEDAALVAACDGTLDTFDLRWSDEAALTVVLAANGYPGAYEKGTEIRGLDDAAATGATVFHAGTATADGAVVTNGGRVLGVTALGDGIKQARDRAYEAVAKIKFPGMQFRRDIGA